MDELFALNAGALQQQALVQELRRCNEVSARYGLVLGEEAMAELVRCRTQALQNSGRLEFGGGVLEKLVTAFCDSPFLTSENYESTLWELVASFYYFKNESAERIPDDELIDLMKQFFDGVCHGSVEYLTGTSLEELCRGVRDGLPPDQFDQYGKPF